MTLDEGHYYITLFALSYEKVSLWLWKSWKTREFFSPTLWPHCYGIETDFEPNKLRHYRIVDMDRCITAV